MARFEIDPNRVNFTLSQTGREYNFRLLQRAQSIFSQLLSLLPSNYVSTVEGASYTVELKAVSVELARLELALEDIDNDIDFSRTRPEFLYTVVGYFVFINGKLPQMSFSDEEFRNVIVNLIRLYFKGSIPKSMSGLVSLFISNEVKVTENFLLIRKGTTGLDISDQFGFDLDVIIPLGEGFPTNLFAADSIIRQLIDVIRPAHTLYRLRFIFKDRYIPNNGKVLDAMRWAMSNYYYDDFRSYWVGVRDRDRLGRKTNFTVTSEDHSMDF